MALFDVVIPGNMSYDASSCDQTLRNITILFGLYSLNAPFSDPMSGTLPDVVRRRGSQSPGAFCARSGNYFPGERLTIDGQGRTVGREFSTDGPAVPEIPPFPVFSKSPST
jgi:hypothetical protein